MSPKRERDLLTTAPVTTGIETRIDPFLSFIASQLFPQLVATIVDHRTAEKVSRG